MSVQLDATPGGGSSNSYTDIATATAFLNGQGIVGAYLDGGGPFISTRLYTNDAWAAASADTQATALIWATSLLDQLVEWFGYKATRAQALRWPRSGVYDPDGFYVDKDIIPTRIKEITAQYALELVLTNRLQEPATTGVGVDDVTLGPIHASIDPRQAFPFVPPYIQALIVPYGILNGMAAGKGGMVQVRLLRT